MRVSAGCLRGVLVGRHRRHERGRRRLVGGRRGRRGRGNRRCRGLRGFGQRGQRWSGSPWTGAHRDVWRAGVLRLRRVLLAAECGGRLPAAAGDRSRVDRDGHRADLRRQRDHVLVVRRDPGPVSRARGRSQHLQRAPRGVGMPQHRSRRNGAVSLPEWIVLLRRAHHDGGHRASLVDLRRGASRERRPSLIVLVLRTRRPAVCWRA